MVCKYSSSPADEIISPLTASINSGNEFIIMYFIMPFSLTYFFTIIGHSNNSPYFSYESTTLMATLFAQVLRLKAFLKSRSYNKGA